MGIYCLSRRVHSGAEVRGRRGGEPGGRFRGVQDGGHVQRPASVQAGRGRELHLLQLGLLQLAGRHSSRSRARLAQEHVGGGTKHQVGLIPTHSWTSSLKTSCSPRWVPDLQAGWEYRPLVRSSFDPLTNSSTSQDGTFRIEALSGLFLFCSKNYFFFLIHVSEVERVSNMIKKLQTERV